MAIIKFKDAWEMYRIKFIIEGKALWEDFWALQGISFSVENGEVLGIIGENGSGKSTILRLIAGMLKPDRGEVEVSGSVSGLLELGAGFQSELTGRENIFLQFELFSLHSGQVKEKFQQVIDFAEIGKFIDAPVKCYSQGMFVRLAFAIAVHMDSDIFLVDDTLAVGDEYFQKKCIKEIFKIKQRGKTVIIVTHDMAMLQKLCARTIFLKHGELLRDEETSRAVSFYSQAVGSPKGIAIIENKQLSLVFNNGRLLLNWNGMLLTLPCGAYTSFLVDGFWHSSTQAEWEVERLDGKIVATGQFYHLAMAQIWRIEITDGFEIKWDIEFELGGGAHLPEMYINLALIDSYKKWFADSGQGDFPEIKEGDKYWKPLPLRGNSSVCIGVYAQASSFGIFPSMLFEQSHLRYRAQAGILNSDYANPGRLLQYKTSPASANLLNHVNRLLCFSGKIILDVADINAYIHKVEKEFIISNGKLKLSFDNGRLAVLYNDLLLTKASHMYSAFFTKQRWFTSDSAIWTLKKETENRMIATGNWEYLGVSQIWIIDIDKDCSFSWDVQMEIRKDIVIEQQRLRCFFSEKFKAFFSEFISEYFSDEFEDADVDLLKRCISSGEVGLQDADARMPVLRVSFSKELGNFIKVFNSDYYNKARILHLEKVEAETNALFHPGKYECFKAKFFLNQDKRREIGSSDNSIEDKDIKFVFNKGSGKFYKDTNELTKNMALYTSMRSSGRWFDSFSSARWKVICKNSREIQAIGKWLDLPLSQEWRISAISPGVFEWKVLLRVENEIELDRLQANIMFSEKFVSWSAGRQAGDLPDFKEDIDDDWDCLWSGDNRGNIVTLKENPAYKLPEVSLSAQELNPQWGLRIVNSDRYHRGRLLQCAFSLNTKFLPGEYPYFSGRLTIKNK